MTNVREISNRFIEQMAALNPIAATSWGIPGSDDKLPDLSPDGLAQRAELERSILRELDATRPESEEDRIAAEVMAERLGCSLQQHDAGEEFHSLRVIGSPHGSVRQIFDLMPTDTEEHWQAIAGRMGNVPAALDQLKRTYREGLDRQQSSAQRQVKACIAQCQAWGGATDPATSFFAGLAGRYPGGPSRDALEAGAATAAEAYLRLGEWLEQEYLPKATPVDPVGRDRYARAARNYTGADLDLAETYEWGWAELYRIEARMASVCERILPGATLQEVIAHIEADPALVIDGVDEFHDWNQNLIDTTIRELNGTHFDIAKPLQTCQAMIAPPGGAAAMYYTPPSEDFARPGRTWYPTLGKTRFPLWREVSICYHEGVPGHHLQIAQVMYLADRLNRYQRLSGFTSGHGEGWALYAERLMDELGYLENPAFELGMLSAQAMRAVRVVVDIGMHLELRIPDTERYHPGETWTPELALPFVIERSCFPADFMASEVDRYLGMPGQAISYKVGERVWLEGRDAARARKGKDFDLAAFHRFALDLGGMGLDQLTRELARF